MMRIKPITFGATILAAFALGLFAGLAFGQTPALELRKAVSDLEEQPPELRPTIRYLSLYNVPPDERDELRRVASFVLNSLSRTRAITSPELVQDTLLRFSIAQYTANTSEFQEWHAAWENLAALDPYWHIRTQVLVPDQSSSRLALSLQPVQVRRRRDPTPSIRALGSPKREAGFTPAPPLKQQSERKAQSPTPNAPAKLSALRTVSVDGGWLSLHDANKLKAYTASGGALLRADYFIFNATHPPAYHDFAGVRAKEADFLASLGIDARTIDKLRANAGANLIHSHVTQKPRRVVWMQGPLGGFYQTLDVEAVTADRDPIRRAITADGLQLNFDASEIFAMAPNGMWRTALFDRNGNRQDAVPDKVAKDTSDPLADGRVVPLASCIRCHGQEAGLNPFADDQSKLLAGDVELYSLDPRLVQRAAEFYDEPRLQRQMQFDRETFALAVSRATNGWTPAQATTAFAKVLREYAYIPVTAATAAGEVGLTFEQARFVLHSTRDPIVLLLLENRTVHRDQWTSSFAEAALVAETWRNQR